MAVPYLGLLFGSHPPCTHTADWSAVQRIIEAQLSRDPMITLLLAFNTPHFSFPSSSRARHHETTRAQAHAPPPVRERLPDPSRAQPTWLRSEPKERRRKREHVGLAPKRPGVPFLSFFTPIPLPRAVRRSGSWARTFSSRRREPPPG
jgi:hypothetical protein